MSQPPSFLIAAPSSGSGKTVVTLALLRAFRNRGRAVTSFKVGPDYIDPAFHTLASGHDCLNMDLWAMQETTVSGNLQHLSSTSDLIIGEGVMGLFDGSKSDQGSTADVARLLDVPVILVVDAKGQSNSVGALIHGFNSFQPDLKISGVIFNSVGSENHQVMLRSAAETVGIPVIGCIPRSDALQIPSRHLGLKQAMENKEIDAFIENASKIIEASLDLDLLETIAKPVQSVTGKPTGNWFDAQHICIAKDKAFSFIYPHLLNKWHEEGHTISFFSPLFNAAPSKDADLIYLPGGYPELHLEKLAHNKNFKSGMRTAANKGTKIYGECGGYMTLGNSIRDKKGRGHYMLGLLPLKTSFAEPKLHLGYRDVTLNADTALGRKGTKFRAHEFHYCTELEPKSGSELFMATDSTGKDLGGYGSICKNNFGSYIHLIDRLPND